MADFDDFIRNKTIMEASFEVTVLPMNPIFRIGDVTAIIAQHAP